MKEIDRVFETTENVGCTLSAIVPQLFFDIIARLLPGFAIIWSFYLAFLGYPPSVLDVVVLRADIANLTANLSGFFLFLITALVFYIVSILFYGLWSAIVKTSCFIKSRLSTCPPETAARFVEVLDASPEFTLRHDFVKLKAPVAGNRITKLKAEIHMSGALTAALLACLLISLIGLFISNLPKEQLYLRCGIFFFGVIGMWFANRHFSVRLCRSVFANSKLLGFDRAPFCGATDFKEC